MSTKNSRRFSKLSQKFEVDLSEVTFSITQIQEVTSRAESQQEIPDKLLRLYKKAVEKADQLKPRLEDYLEDMRLLSESFKQQSVQDKLKNQLKRRLEELDDSKNHFEELIYSKGYERKLEKIAVDSQRSSYQTDFKQSAIGLDQNGQQILKVYEQSKEVAQRGQKVAVLRQEAQQINNIAQDIYMKIDDQGMRLDDLNKQFSQDAEKIKDANEELKVAAENNRKDWKCLGLTVLAICLIVISGIVYLLFRLEVIK